jgi:hypothetical protein
MKRVLGIIICLLISLNIYSNDIAINFRDYYYAVCLSEKPIQEFDSYLALYKESNNVTIKGYQAVIWFLWADFYFSPIKKWECFSKGVLKLDQLIMSYPDNPELRFLRLTVQENVPFFLSYNLNVKEDKSFINSKLNEILDSDLKERITNYLNESSQTKIK